MKHKLFILITLSVMLLASVPPALAGANKYILEVPPATLGVACYENDVRVFYEQIILEGSGILIVNSMTKGDGRYHYNIVQNVHLSGVGQTTGDTYRQVNGGATVLNYDGDDLPYVATRVIRTLFISEGSGYNILLRRLEHTTINANGDVSVTFSNREAECHGR